MEDEPEMSATPEIQDAVVSVVEATDSITALELVGEFDLNAVPTLLENAERALGEGRDLIVNLSDATFIDSSIVHTLFEANESARSAGRVLVLQFGTHAAVERVLSITGADTHLVTASTRLRAIELVEQLGAQAPAA